MHDLASAEKSETDPATSKSNENKKAASELAAIAADMLPKQSVDLRASTPDEVEQDKKTAKAQKAVEAADARSREQQLLDGLDFSDPYKFEVSLDNTYHAPAAVDQGHVNRRTVGEGNQDGHPRKTPEGHHISGHLGAADYPDAHFQNTWGNPREMAHLEHRVVEQVGIREKKIYATEFVKGKERADGWRGYVGFKKEVIADHNTHDTGEIKYILDYTFSAPGTEGDTEDSEAAQAAGNYTGQHIDFHLELPPEQALELAELIREDPTIARQVLDRAMEATGHAKTWNDKVIDDEGNFHDPGAEDDKDYLARDVRPNYDAVPGLEPKRFGLAAPKHEQNTGDSPTESSQT
jgi:hypothetical protein